MSRKICPLSRAGVDGRLALCYNAPVDPKGRPPAGLADSEEGAGDLEDTMFSEEEGGENGSLYRRYTETHYQRGYTLAEIQELLERAGLVFIEAYDADTKETPNDTSERICVIARENGK